MRKESFLSSLGSGILWKGLDRLAGLAKHVIIAGAIGLSAQLDVFYMAIALLGVLVFSWATMMDVVAVPSLVKAWQEGKLEEFRRIASGLFSLTLVGSMLLALIFYMGRDFLALIAFGFEAERRQLLVNAIPWLLPVILLYIPLRLLGSVLRSIRQFSPFYQAEFLIALVVLVCVALFRQDGHVLLWSFSAGVTLAFVFLLFKSRYLVLPMGHPYSSTVRQSLRLAPGLLILQGAHYVYVLTDRIFVSYLPTGAVSALAYAMTLVSLLPGVISLSGSFITVIAEKDNREGRGKHLKALLSMSIFLAMGATSFLLMAGEAMVQILLERGVFTAADTQIVTTAIFAYAWMILPLFLIGPLDQIFQVERRIGLMVRRAALGMVTNIVLNAWFLFDLGWGLFGIALATSISYWIMLIAGLGSLKRLGYPINGVRHLKWGVWIAVFLVPSYFGATFLPNGLIKGPPQLLASALLVAGALWISAWYYTGEESELLRKTLSRCMPRGIRT